MIYQTLKFTRTIEQYPTITTNHTKKKIKQSIKNITSKSGINSKEFFEKLFNQ